MFDTVRHRFKQGRQTLDFPEGPAPLLPDRFRGLPILDASKCPSGCAECVAACPTNAISWVPGGHHTPVEASAEASTGGTVPSGSSPVRPAEGSRTTAGLQIDLGRCLFCTDCQEACPSGAVTYSKKFDLATRTRQDLLIDGEMLQPAAPLDSKLLRILGRSLKLRHISGGGDAGSHSAIQALNNVLFDLPRFGIEIVNSPLHADGLLITGPISAQMRPVVIQTYAALATPKIVIAVGTSAISGGIFVKQDEQHTEPEGPQAGRAGSTGVEGILPIDLYIPGHPPHPLTILDGLLRLLNLR